jgi:hypothetical protein
MAQRFTWKCRNLIGAPPIEYLALWRVQLAGDIWSKAQRSPTLPLASATILKPYSIACSSVSRVSPQRPGAAEELAYQPSQRESATDLNSQRLEQRSQDTAMSPLWANSCH